LSSPAGPSGIFENKIPGFFGIYDIKENVIFKALCMFLTNKFPNNPNSQD